MPRAPGGQAGNPEPQARFNLQNSEKGLPYQLWNRPKQHAVGQAEDRGASR